MNFVLLTTFLWTFVVHVDTQCLLERFRCSMGCRNGNCITVNLIACRVNCIRPQPTAPATLSPNTSSTSLATISNTSPAISSANTSVSSLATMSTTTTSTLCSSSNLTCNNGGRCSKNNSHCICPDQWTGVQCERRVYTICRRSRLKCYNNATCNNTITCVCNGNWRGSSCNKYCGLDCGMGRCIIMTINGTETRRCNCPWLNSTHKHDSSDGCKPVCRINCGVGHCVVLTVRGRKVPKCQCPYLNSTHEYDSVSECSNITASEIQSKHDSSKYWLPVGITFGCVAVFIIIVVILLIILWKKRVIFLMKIVYKLKPYVDTEDKKYDAFISYKSSGPDGSASNEEHFVIKYLLPYLESLGFDCCVHFRDFLPGLSVGDNIIQSVEDSHRTIIVISRSYILNSFWSKYEYEQAQVAVIKRKQRIIPIVYEDIGDIQITDPTLKVILESTTYLKKPEDLAENKKAEEFWTRLRLSMPKKSPEASRNNTVGGAMEMKCDSTSSNGSLVPEKSKDIYTIDNTSLANGGKQNGLDTKVDVQDVRVIPMSRFAFFHLFKLHRWSNSHKMDPQVNGTFTPNYYV